MATAFTRLTTICALIGNLLMCQFCLTLFQIPNKDSGYPLPLSHEILYVFAAGCVFGIFLNLLVFLMDFLIRINERKPNKIKIQKYFNKLNRVTQIADVLIFLLGTMFSIYILITGIFGFLSLIYSNNNKAEAGIAGLEMAGVLFDSQVVVHQGNGSFDSTQWGILANGFPGLD